MTKLPILFIAAAAGVNALPAQAFAETLNGVPADKLMARCQGYPFPHLIVGSGGSDIYRTSEYQATDPSGNCAKDARALQVRLGAAAVAHVPVNIRLNGDSPLKDFTFAKTLQLQADKLTAVCRASHAWDESGFPVLQVVTTEGVPDGVKALVYETTSYNTIGQWDNCEADARSLMIQFNAAKLVNRKIVFKAGNSPKKDFRIAESDGVPAAPAAVVESVPAN